MNNKKYSLTAKERKELKNKEGKQSRTVKAVEKDEDAADIVDSQGNTAIKKNRKVFSTIVAIAMITLVLTGIVVAILLIDEARRPQGNRPIATIKLSTGDELNFALYQDTAPVAVANFMYLSLQGFYNDTVIHDNQNNWLRFMGLKDYDTNNTIAYSKTEDSVFYNSFTGFENWKKNKAVDKNIFWYRLNSESTSVKFDTLTRNEGLLCFMYSYSSCLFQISCVNGPNTWINKTDRKNFTVMGSYNDDETLQTIQRLNKGQEQTANNGAWYNPSEVIKIVSVKISNYKESDWEGRKGILNNFDTYIEEKGGYRSYSSEYYNYNDILS